MYWTKESIKEASSKCPDPELAEYGLIRFSEHAGDTVNVVFQKAAMLFSYSRFLSNFCITSPHELEGALFDLNKPFAPDFVTGDLEELKNGMGLEEALAFLRQVKKRHLLKITLRDVLGLADFMETLNALTSLADSMIGATFEYSVNHCISRFGDPPSGSSSCIIGLGKLGGMELNYSSDVDLLSVYTGPDGTTAGVQTPSGIRTNRVSLHEFYVKVTETLSRLLSLNTEHGIAYRVDLRLRPQGQRSDIALHLDAYRDYYLSWGRTWERMVLIRARPVAGSRALGTSFMSAVEPFVWRSTSDYSEVQEIRAMKKTIDSTYLKDDIKRGYGGIREAEFFVQTFQLMYSPMHPALKTNSIFDAVDILRGTGLVPGAELDSFTKNYIHLRKIEHYLQMKDDLQTHSLPEQTGDMEALSKKMGFAGSREFTTDLKIRRLQIKSMYNSLLGAREDIHAEAMSVLSGSLSDEEAVGYLRFRGVKDADKGALLLKSIIEKMGEFKTGRELEDIRKTVPDLFERAMASISPDRALAGLEGFISAFGLREAYVAAFAEKKELAGLLTGIFSLSPYLTRAFLSSPSYIGMLIEEMLVRKTFKRTVIELKRNISRDRGLSIGIAGFKRLEELRLGALFLSGIISETELNRYLSHIADACAGEAISGAGGGLCVVGMGKLGGREITFGSDLDIIFVSEDSSVHAQAESVIRTLSEYTDYGMPYSIDARLRPDGSKGVLVNTVEGYEDYYLKSAKMWEVQALIKARPVSGSHKLRMRFMLMAGRVLRVRGGDMSKDYISSMRERIIKEHLPKEGLDIKLMPGGLEDIEFFVQSTQLRNAESVEGLLVQNTLSALGRAGRAGILTRKSCEDLSGAYRFFRRLEVLMRLNEEKALIEDSHFGKVAALFMGFKDESGIFKEIEGKRISVLGTTGM